jgi:hypothetical protein
VRAVAALWCEHEDIESLKTQKKTQAGTAKSPKPTSLDIYQEVLGLELYPGGTVSVKRVRVGQTVHRFEELLGRTDDRTQVN